MDGLLGRFTPKPLRKLAGSLLGIRTQQKKEATHKKEASQVTKATNVHNKVPISSIAQS